MFRSTIKLLLETPENPFIAPATRKFIQPFLKIVGYQGDVDKDFLHYIRQKKDVIQYLRFTKLIIANLMKKFPFIPQRLEEDYHSIKDDIPLYKEYEKVFFKVDVPMIQSQLVESTQGTNRTPRAHRTPTPTAVVGDVVQKKRHQVARETSSPMKSIKVTIRKKKTTILLSLTMHKTAITAEAQENVAKVYENILEEDIAKMVDGKDEDSYASDFADLVFQDDDDDSGNTIEPESHKENPKTVDDDDDVNEEEKKDEKKDHDDKKDDTEDNDNDDHTDHTLVGTQVTGSLETRKEKMQTPIPLLLRSPRTNLSLDKTILQKLTTTISPTPDTTSRDHSKPTSINTKVLPGSIARMSRRRGKIRKHLKTTFITNAYFQEKMKEIHDML
ncbi:hypothetical protein Tco_1074536 [Tanacetum coccineum]